MPGRPPLGGEVLSHDQIEAVLMRRAGWEVRVLPIEDGSFETNPPTLLDFIKRDLRWGHGNIQYARLLDLAGSNSIVPAAYAVGHPDVYLVALLAWFRGAWAGSAPFPGAGLAVGRAVDGTGRPANWTACRR